MVEKNDRDDRAVNLSVRTLLPEISRRGSDRLKNLPVDEFELGDIFNVCDVLPQDPTIEQYDDLAVRLSNFLEDLHRVHVDRRVDQASVLSQGCVPFTILIIDRAAMAQHLAALWVPAYGSPPPWPTEKKTLCVLYLKVTSWSVPGWQRGPDVRDGKVMKLAILPHEAQLHRIDEVARRHGLRCVEQGQIP